MVTAPLGNFGWDGMRRPRTCVQSFHRDDNIQHNTDEPERIAKTGWKRCRGSLWLPMS